MWPSRSSIPVWASSIFSQRFLVDPSPLSNGPGHQKNPNDVPDKWSISWQLQHLSPWQSCPQTWPRRFSCGATLPPPRLCLGSFLREGWGVWGGAELVGSCGWVDGWGRPLCAVERGRPTTQTDMLTANTNMAKQMVHAYLFRFPFKCTPQLCESALSCIEGRTYQLPSSLLTLKRPFHSGTMRGLLLSLGPQPLPHHV